MEFIHFILEAVLKRYVVILEVAILYFCRQSNLKHIKLALALTRKQCWLKLIEQVKDFKSFVGISYVQNISQEFWRKFNTLSTVRGWIYFFIVVPPFFKFFLLHKKSYINIIFDALVQHTCFIIKSHVTMLCSKNLHCLGNILLWGVANWTNKLLEVKSQDYAEIL